MTEQELKRKAQSYPDTEETRNAFRELKKINRTYHYCLDWDGLLICDQDPEAQVCTCEHI